MKQNEGFFISRVLYDDSKAQELINKEGYTASNDTLDSNKIAVYQKTEYKYKYI